MEPLNILSFELVSEAIAGRDSPAAQLRIDGTPLAEIDPDGRHHVDFLGGWHRDCVRAAALHLSGDSPSVEMDGRAPLLVCGACGDSYCRTLSVKVETEGDRVRWRDLRLTEPCPWEDWNGEVLGGPTFVFDREQVRAVLREAILAVYGAPMESLAMEVGNAAELPVWGGVWPFPETKPPA